MMKHLKSLREFLAELDAIGQLQPIDREVDWNLEIQTRNAIRPKRGSSAPTSNMAGLGRLRTSCRIGGIPTATVEME